MKTKKIILEIIKIILVAMAILIMPILYSLRIGITEGQSMYPFIDNSEGSTTILLLKNSILSPAYDRGDIVAIDASDEIEDEDNQIVKRIIGLEGDHVEIKNNKVYINGVLYEEPYLDGTDYTMSDLDVYVPYEYVFCMGDNRDRSADSRVYGCFRYDDIVGKYVMTLD